MADKKPNKTSEKSNSSFALKRVLIGMIGMGLLLVWVFFYFTWGWEEVIRSAPVAIMGRVGLIMTALWVALPTLQPLFKHASSLVMGALLLILFVLAARPKILPIVLGIIVVGLAVNWVLRLLSGGKSRPGKNQ